MSRSPNYRRWAAELVGRLFEWRRAGVPLKVCARRLGRTALQVGACLTRHGWTFQPRDPAGVRRAVRKAVRAAGGWPDVPAVARQIGCHPSTVRGHLHRLGVRRSAGMASRHATRTARARRAAGLAASRAEGWPGVRPAMARVLDVLYAGPADAAAVAREAGLKASSAGVYLAALRAAGHLVRVRRGVYALAADVREGRRRTLAYQSAVPA